MVLCVLVSISYLGEKGSRAVICLICLFFNILRLLCSNIINYSFLCNLIKHISCYCTTLSEKKKRVKASLATDNMAINDLFA